MTTGSVPVKLPQIQLSSLKQTNTNTKWHANFVFAKSSQKVLVQTANQPLYSN